MIAVLGNYTVPVEGIIKKGRRERGERREKERKREEKEGGKKRRK
jgi:hypothetical protein